MVLKVIKNYSHLIHGLVMLLLVAILTTLTACQARDGSNWTEQRLGNERISDLVRNSSTSQNDSLAARLDFEETKHSFDTIIEGSIVSHKFHFVNGGKAPMLITAAKSSCGCTVPTWPRDVISVGEAGVIEVEFDSENRSGQISKSIRIIANTIPRETTLNFTVFVKPRVK